MTAPRTGLFQRSPTSNTPAGPGDNAGGPPPETGEDGGAEMCVCPQCGCEFDPENPESYVPPQGGAPDMGGGGQQDIAAMLGMQ